MHRSPVSRLDRRSLIVCAVSLCGIVGLNLFSRYEPVHETPVLQTSIIPTPAKRTKQLPTPETKPLILTSTSDIPISTASNIVEEDKPLLKPKMKKEPIRLNLSLTDSSMDDDSSSCGDGINQPIRVPFKPIIKTPTNELFDKENRNRGWLNIAKEAGEIRIDDETGEVHIKAKVHTSTSKLDATVSWETPHLPEDITLNPIYNSQNVPYAIYPQLNKCGDRFNKLVGYVADSPNGQKILFRFRLSLTAGQVSDAALPITRDDVKDLFTILVVYHISTNGIDLDKRSLGLIVSQLMSQSFEPVVRQIKARLSDNSISDQS